MKTELILGLLLLATILPAQTITTNSYNYTTPGLVPDNNPSGWATTFTVSGLGGAITNIQVALDITGGFNGDLYAYLLGPTGQMAVLLNRVGISGSQPYGYSDAGFNIVLDGAALNSISSYQGVTNPLGGAVTGTWAADGRNVNPQASGAVIFGTSATLGLNNFDGTDANGVWTVFIADLSPGGQSTIQSVILTIMTVPEPSPWALFALGGLALLLVQGQRLRKI